MTGCFQPVVSDWYRGDSPDWREFTPDSQSRGVQGGNSGAMGYDGVMNAPTNWREVLKAPTLGDHIVQVYQDEEFLAEAVGEYAGVGLRQDEGVLIIATPGHRRAFERQLGGNGLDTAKAIAQGQLQFLEADAVLAKLMRDGMPDWNAFHAAVGAVIAELRLQHPTVRAYGEMVDILWQKGERDAAIRLEEYWNELGKLQTFSLFCAYFMDNLDAGAYGGPLECVCKVHTHLIPARDYARFNDAVTEASRKVLDEPLSRMMISLAATRRPGTEMPLGQAVLLWLRKNMPRTAERVLSEVRART